MRASTTVGTTGTGCGAFADPAAVESNPNETIQAARRANISNLLVDIETHGSLAGCVTNV
jgi:hypothetical protein